MVVAVMKILVNNVPLFQELKDRVPAGVIHEHTNDLRVRSDIVNLGVIDVNPSNTGGAIDVLDHLKQYVPKVNDIPINTPCHGDGLSIECIGKAKKARSVFRSPEHDLSCFLECAQEFHKEGINLEV